MNTTKSLNQVNNTLLEKITSLKELYYLSSKDAFEITNSKNLLDKKLNNICNNISIQANLENSPKTFYPTIENFTRLHYPIYSKLKSMGLQELSQENIEIFNLFHSTIDKSFISKVSLLSLSIDPFNPSDKDPKKLEEKIKTYGNYYSEFFKILNNPNGSFYNLFELNFKKRKTNKKNIPEIIQKGIVDVLNLLEEKKEKNPKKTDKILEIQPNLVTSLKKLGKKIQNKIISENKKQLNIIEISEIIKYNPEFLSTLFFIGNYITPARKLYNQKIGMELDNQTIMFKTLRKVNSFLNEVILGVVLNKNTYDEIQSKYQKDLLYNTLNPSEIALKILNEGADKKLEYYNFLINTILKKVELQNTKMNYDILYKKLYDEIRINEKKSESIDTFKSKLINKNLNDSEKNTIEELETFKKELKKINNSLKFIYFVFNTREKHIKSLIQKNTT
ncbi:MAG: hypothetical protein QXD23_01145 [Candidatus Micrarchaeaceae archaeon]